MDPRPLAPDEETKVVTGGKARGHRYGRTLAHVRCGGPFSLVVVEHAEDACHEARAVPSQANPLLDGFDGFDRFGILSWVWL